VRPLAPAPPAAPLPRRYEAEGGGGSSQVPFVLAERARSECARSMRAVKGNLGHSLYEKVQAIRKPSLEARM